MQKGTAEECGTRQALDDVAAKQKKKAASSRHVWWCWELVQELKKVLLSLLGALAAAEALRAHPLTVKCRSR
jgi:hypothetical protein